MDVKKGMPASLVLVAGLIFGGAGFAAKPVKKASSVTASATKLPPLSDKPLKTYELRVNTQMEWLVLEQLKLGSQPTHFLKFRRGQRTIAMSVIPKKDFDRWTRDIMAIKTPRQPACAHPFEARAFVDGIKYLNRFCPGPAADPEVRNITQASKEMLTHLRQYDALKGRGR